MWMSSTSSNTTNRRVARLEVRARTLRLPLHRSFAKATKRATIERPTCNIELPLRLWDRIILFMFICCLFTFLHALLGFGVADHDLNASNHTKFRTPLFTPPLQSWNAAGANENWRILAQGGAQMMVDWHGNYELLPSTTSDNPISAAMIAQAFPGPTSASFRSGHHGAEGKASHSMTIEVETSVDIPLTLHGDLYDPFQLGFEGSVEGGEDRGRYPVTGQPRTVSPRARKRRFGRCLPEDVCL